MSLCQACRRFDVQLFAVRNERPRRGIPAFTVVNGADAGCNFCSFLIDAFATEHPNHKRFLNQWFHLSPHFQTPRPESGMGLLGFDLELSALLSSEWFPRKGQQIIVQTTAEKSMCPHIY
jgi:hypothetical protein